MSKAPQRNARRSKVDLTQGAVAPKLLSLAAPLVAGNILQTVYNLVDMFWVGKLGAAEVAAVSIVFPTAWLLISIAMGVTIAGAALVSQWTGAGDPDQASFSAAQMLTLATIVATLLAGGAYMGRFALMAFLGATGDLFEPTLAYLSIIFWSVPFTFIFYSYQSALRGVGDTVRPMYLVIASNVLNMVLDPFLIFGWGPFPEMGVAGAAWATLLARAIAAGVGLWFLLRPGGALTIRPRQLIPHWPTQYKILNLGIPGGIDGAARSFSAVAMVALITRFGPVATAAYGIGVRVMSLVWTISGAVGQGVGVGVGQNLGANQPERAARVAWVGTFGDLALLSGLGITAAIFAPQIVDVFVNDSEVVAEGTNFLRITGWGFGLSGALMVIQGAFQGAGRTGYSMILSLMNRWLLRLPIAWALAWPLGFGVAGLWWGYFLSDALGFVMGAGWMKWGPWQQNLVGEGSPGEATEHAGNAENTALGKSTKQGVAGSAAAD